MGAMKEYPRYHVVSARISDDEMMALQRLVGERQASMSQLVREALALFCCPDEEGREGLFTCS